MTPYFLSKLFSDFHNSDGKWPKIKCQYLHFDPLGRVWQHTWTFYFHCRKSLFEHACIYLIIKTMVLLQYLCVFQSAKNNFSIKYFIIKARKCNFWKTGRQQHSWRTIHHVSHYLLIDQTRNRAACAGKLRRKNHAIEAAPPVVGSSFGISWFLKLRAWNLEQSICGQIRRF